MPDEVYSVVIKGYILRKDYMDKPSNWDWSNLALRVNDLLDVPTITIIKLDEGVMDTDE